MQQAMHSFTGKLRAWRASKTMMGRLLDDMWTVAQSVRPELIVYHIKATPACDIAEALGCVALPSFQIPAFVATGAFPSPLLPFGNLGRVGNRLSHQALLGLMTLVTGRPLRRWRRDRLGLSARTRHDPFAGYHPRGEALPRLHGYSRHLVPETESWPARERVTGGWFLEPAADWRPPEALESFLEAGPPPVYVGFGSMPSDDSGQLTASVRAALALTGQRGVLASGWGGLADAADDARVHHLEAAPHDWLFARCAAVVHHGGAGTTHQALLSGRPQVVCPLFADQPFWGARIAALGAGPAPLPLGKLTAEALARALEAAQAPAVADRVSRIGAAMALEPGVSGAAALIDDLVSPTG